MRETIISVDRRTPPRKNPDADFKIAFARRSSRFSDSNTLILARSAVVVPATAPSSMSARRTHLRTDSTPNPNWSPTRRTVP